MTVPPLPLTSPPRYFSWKRQPEIPAPVTLSCLYTTKADRGVFSNRKVWPFPACTKASWVSLSLMENPTGGSSSLTRNQPSRRPLSGPVSSMRPFSSVVNTPKSLYSPVSVSLLAYQTWKRTLLSRSWVMELSLMISITGRVWSYKYASRSP